MKLAERLNQWLTITPPQTGLAAVDRGTSPVTGIQFRSGVEPDKILTNWSAYAKEGYSGNGPISALINVRMMAFSEATFHWVAADGTPDKRRTGLEVLDVPWLNGSTGDLLATMELDVSLGGNSYSRVIRAAGRPFIERLHPPDVDVVTNELGQLVGYWHYRNGRYSGDKPEALTPDEVAHYKPRPKAGRPHVGESWITAIAREADSDTRMTGHKDKFFENAATPNLAIKTEQQLTDDQKAYLERAFSEKFEGWGNAYKTVILEGGADLMPLGSSFEQMTFTTVQAAGETRIAAAAGVPPVVVGFLQGIQAATYSNYSQAMRRFGDLTVRPLWRFATTSLATIVTPPNRTLTLAYNDTDIPFLQQDAKDAADIRKADAATIRQLVDGGFEPDSAIKAVISDDFANLVHTGLVSVQLQPPGTELDNETGDSDDGDA